MNENLDTIFSYTGDSTRDRIYSNTGIKYQKFKGKHIEPGGSDGIYRVETIEERDSLQVNDGDICLVYKNVSNPIISDSTSPINITSDTVYFPERVTFDNPITNSSSIYMRDISSSTMIDCYLNSSSASIRVDDHNSGIWLDISYSTTDSKTYIREEQVESSRITPSYYEVYMFNENCAKFLLCNNVDFSIYEYKNNNWSYLNIGIPDSVLKNVYDASIYTNNGYVQGSLGGSKSDVDDSILTFKCYTSLDISNITDLKDIFWKVSDYGNTKNFDPSFVYKIQDVSPYITNWSNAFRDIEFTRESDRGYYCVMPYLDLRNAVSMSQMFYNVKITKLDLSKWLWPQNKKVDGSDLFGISSTLTHLITPDMTDCKYIIGHLPSTCNYLKITSHYNGRSSSLINADELFMGKDSNFICEYEPGLFDNVTSYLGTFHNYKGSTLPISINSNPTYIVNMCYGCINITEAPLINTTNLSGMTSAFSGCSSLTDVSRLDLRISSSKTDFSVSNLFKDCISLVTLPQMDFTHITNIYNRYYGNTFYFRDFIKNCPNLSRDSIRRFVLALPYASGYSTGYNNLSMTGLTLEQYNLLTSSEKQTILNKGWAAPTS